MKRILFLLLWIIPLFGDTRAKATIEIYVKGHKYDSSQEYLASKESDIAQKNFSDRTLHKLYVLSVENGMVDALKDFYQSWGQGGFQMPGINSSEQLQDAIQQAVTTSKGPKLLISQSWKVRIMALTTADTPRKSDSY